MATKEETPDTSVIIQRYLENFNSEVQLHQQSLETDHTEEVVEDEEDEGTYFVDQQGRYYYQATPDSQPVLATPIEDDQGEEITLAEDSQQMEGEEEVVGKGFQTVTLMPSETGDGEVSYVLIVQQPDDQQQNAEGEDGGEEVGVGGGEEGGEGGLTVYDFEEEEDEQTEEVSDAEDDKSKITKLPMKKPQRNQRHKCNYCSYTSPRRYLLARHTKTHSEERPYQCSVCERGFKTLASLTNHVNTHTGVKPHHCKFCSSAFTTSGELIRHIRYRHTHEKPHKCHECDYASVELSKLRRHLRCHTGERPYQCPHCTYASPDTFKLKRHLRTHTGEKPYVCDICDMAFTQSNSLKGHKLIHNIEAKPMFQCELCPATCGRKTDLRIHIQKLHTSDTPIKCKRCRKSFPDKYTYKLHNKTHEGEKCYKCEICPYASTTQRHLSSHMLKHTDEKPFSCPECDQAFRQKQLLRRHYNLYHNPSFKPPPPKDKTHECGECKRQFAHKGNLIRHMAVHDPESDFHEKQLQLKLGRAKRINEYMPHFVEEGGEEFEGEYLEYEEVGEDGEELGVEAGEGEGAAGDGYVVLEVIQVPGRPGEEGQQVAIVAPDNYQDGLGAVSGGDEDGGVYARERGAPVNIKIEKDMDACFGFDEEEDEEEREKKLVKPNMMTVRILSRN